jgi:hypothetical protein
MRIIRAILWIAYLATLSAFIPSIALSTEEQSSISALFEILYAIYDYDSSLIPNEPNEIIDLETSSDSRDQLAWVIFQLIRYELDPNSRPPDVLVSVSSEELIDPVAELSAEESTEVEESPAMDFPMMMAMESEPATDLYGPLDSCILTPGTYRIQTLPLEIEGHVVIPAGTTLIAPFDPNVNIIEVMPGGLLDMGRAAFYEEQDYPEVLPPVRIESEDPNQSFHNNQIGIYVQRGADPKTRIENTIIKNCSIGILVDEVLYNPIRSVITFGCYDGIHLYAPGGIIDCQFWFNGSVFDWMLDYILAHLDDYLNGTLFDSIRHEAGVGIYVRLDGAAYPYPEAVIERTLMYYGDTGLFIDSVVPDPNWPDPNDLLPLIPNIRVVNSCIASNLFGGFYQSPGEAQVDVSYCAFGDNWYDTNVSLPFAGCIVLMRYPFYNREEDWENLYILPTSELVDAGYGVATDGMGTCSDWPDTGVLDIGCHFPLGSSGNFGIPSCPSDFNWDGIVDSQDLALMNACMGATDDPNLVRMDFNYDSWINMPDYGVLSWDFGYTADPNLAGHHDPNSQRSDFNADFQVDLEDLAILTENWLIPVFDEYRFCSLCNLHIGIDPNDPNAPGGSHVIDQRDIDVFMEDWGKSVVLNPSISFYDPNGQPVEPNQLFGVVTVQIDEHPVSTWIFAQVDGSPAGETYLDSGVTPAFEIPTYAYSNGCHILTLGGYTLEDGCWIKEFPVEFNNFIYFASIPDMYEPNELYEITGFFDGGTVEISTEPNISTIYDGGYIKHDSFINPSNPMAAISYQNGEESKTMNATLSESVDISKIDLDSYRALIVAPCKDVNNAFEDFLLGNDKTITTIRSTLKQENIPYIELIYKNAHWENLKIALTAPNLNYVYWIGHANSHVGRIIDEDTHEVIAEGVPRTGFICWDKKKWLWPDKESRVFSFVLSETSNPEYKRLPDDWDNRGHSMWSLRLWETKTIKEFWAIGCLSGTNFLGKGWNDMARSVGVYYFRDAQGNYTHIYIGNKEEIMAGGVANLLVGYPSAISKIIRRHSATNLDNALSTNDLNEPELEALWGGDYNRDGYTDNTLQWWPSDIELFRVVFN